MPSKTLIPWTQQWDSGKSSSSSRRTGMPSLFWPDPGGICGWDQDQAGPARGLLIRSPRQREPEPGGNGKSNGQKQQHGAREPVQPSNGHGDHLILCVSMRGREFRHTRAGAICPGRRSCSWNFRVYRSSTRRAADFSCSATPGVQAWRSEPARRREIRPPGPASFPGNNAAG